MSKTACQPAQRCKEYSSHIKAGSEPDTFNSDLPAASEATQGKEVLGLLAGKTHGLWAPG